MSTQSASLEMIQEIPILGNLSQEECRQLAEIGVLMTFNPGEVIVREGKQSQNLWVVLEGECEVFREREGQEIVFTRLGRHDNFGEMSFFHPAPHSASVRARTNVKLFRVGRTSFDKLIDNGNSAAYKLAYNSVQSLAERLRRMDEWVEQLIGKSDAGDKVHEWSHFRSNMFNNWNI